MTMSIVDATTGEVKAHPVFVATLGASSFTYAEVLAPLRDRTACIEDVDLQHPRGLDRVVLSTSRPARGS
jgi:hypothetical protein